MPTTWTAQKIHFLTQPELRALFRVITRKRDRALSYRERGLLGRPLRNDEAREVTSIARRIAAILLLQPALDSNYRNITSSTFR